MKISIVFFLSLFLYSSLQGLTFGEFKFKFHGKFCGDDIPKVNATSKEDELRLLNEIEPIDEIDKACKRHDLCYVQRGDNDEGCDAQLVEDMLTLHDRLEDDACRRFSESIIYYFKIRNDNVFTLLDDDGSVADRMRKLPPTTFRNMVKTGAFSSMAGMNYGVTKPVGYIFDSKNNKERLKEVFQIFPPRYKKCELKSERTDKTKE